MRCGLLIAAAGVAGCKSGPAPAASAAQRARALEKEPVVAISNTDACAMRLHDICEPLLLYYLMRNQLPGRLEELRQVPGFEKSLDLTCPVSKKAYIYNPVGLMRPGEPERVILYDPAPSHSGMRWAVSIIEPEDGKALVTKVIALPESHFTFMGDRGRQ
jgi:hypothetical protein